MRKLLFLVSLSCILASCTTTTTLYSWDDYVNSSYKYYKKQTPEAAADLMKTYEDIIKNQKGTRKVVPPGICAEYGYFLIQTGKQEEGLAMFTKEKELYPESAVFMDHLIKKFTK